VIVNWNTGNLLSECIESVYAETKQCDFEIIVLDNASSDNSIDLVEEKYKEVRVIRNKANLGFSAANNLGVKEAEGEFIILLNPDTKIIDGALDKLWLYAKKNRAVTGAAGAKLLNEDMSFQREQGLRFPGLWTAFFQYFFLSHFFGLPGIFMNHDVGRAKEVDWLCGACLCCQREVYERIGGMDERYFLYAEDMDLCRRIKEAGYKIVYYPDAQIIHYSKQSVKKQDEKVLKLQVQSLKDFYALHHNKLSYFVFKNIIFFGLIFRLLAFVFFSLFDRSGRSKSSIQGIRVMLKYVYA
jgi:GT2 family glycosyltransferase